jgi:hypothetical protein
MNVIKCNSYEDRVEIMENLRMREYPDVNAETVILSVSVPYFNEEGNFYQEVDETKNIVRAGEVYYYERKTVKKETIDGITAPWYRIEIVLNDYEVARVWVFGGYVKELPPDEREE